MTRRRLTVHTLVLTAVLAGALSLGAGTAAATPGVWPTKQQCQTAAKFYKTPTSTPVCKYRTWLKHNNRTGWGMIFVGPNSTTY